MRRVAAAFVCFVVAGLILAPATPAKIRWDRVVKGVAELQTPLVPGQTASLTVSGMPTRAPIRSVFIVPADCPASVCPGSVYGVSASVSDRGQAQLEFVVGDHYLAQTYDPVNAPPGGLPFLMKHVPWVNGQPVSVSVRVTKTKIPVNRRKRTRKKHVLGTAVAHGSIELGSPTAP